MLANMASSLILKKRITTTEAKAEAAPAEEAPAAEAPAAEAPAAE